MSSSLRSALRLAARTTAPVQPAASARAHAPAQTNSMRQSSNWTVYITIALSGACALGAEVVWTRLMGMMLGATVYVFSIILAVFLAGARARQRRRFGVAAQDRARGRRLGWCQILLAGGDCVDRLHDRRTLCPIGRSTRYSPQVPGIPSNSIWCAASAAILPPAILWGASFPLALAAAASPGEDPGRVVGGIYAANTLGAIVGALSVSLALIPWIGTQQISARAAGAFCRQRAFRVGALCP